ncbi:MAG: hypothetical protein V1773_18545 [bacterium]
MKKVLATLFILLLVVGFTNAQPKNYIGAGVEIGMASGNFADALDLSAGFGGSARYEMSLSPNMAGYGSVGYLSWGGDNYTLSAVVIMAGGKYYFVPNIYGVAEVGYSSFSLSVDGGGTAYDLDSKIGFGVGAGIEVPVGSMMLDLTAMYKLAATDFNYIDIRAGLKFAL